MLYEENQVSAKILAKTLESLHEINFNITGIQFPPTLSTGLFY